MTDETANSLGAYAYAYAMSEKHLSGYRLIVGFDTLEQVHAAHEALVQMARAVHETSGNAFNPGPVGSYPSSEEFYAARDTFRRYVADEVNPARKAHGLTEIRDDEANECFRIIDQLCQRMDSARLQLKASECLHEWVEAIAAPSFARCKRCGEKRDG